MRKEELGFLYRRFGVEDIKNIVLSKPLINAYNGLQMICDEDEQSAQIEFINQRRWFLYRLRDRSFDGIGWRKTKLVEWDYNKPTDVKDEKGIEWSTYFGNPQSPLTDVFTEEEANFIENPLEALPFVNPNEENLLNWLRLYDAVVSKSEIPPGGFFIRGVQDIFKRILKNTEYILADRYERLWSVPPWYHIAKLHEFCGFEYFNEEDEMIVRKIETMVPPYIITASWIVVLQFWNKLVEEQGGIPEDYVGNHLVLRDEDGSIITYPLTPERNLWMVKEI